MLDSYQKQSCNEIELILLNNTESCSQQTSHFSLDQYPSFKITKTIKMNDLQYILENQFNSLNKHSLSTRFSVIYIPLSKSSFKNSVKKTLLKSFPVFR